MTTLEERLPRWLTLRYPPGLESELPGIEERFRAAHDARAQGQIRLVTGVLIGVYLCYLPLTLLIDLGLSPARVADVIGLELFGLAVTATAFAFSLRTRALQGVVACGAAAIGAQAGAVCLLFGPPHDVAALQSLILLCAAVYTAARLRLIAALPAGLAIPVAFAVEAALFGQLDDIVVFQTVVYLLTANGVGAFAAYAMERGARHDFLQGERLAAERERSERLLLNVLPRSVAARLKAGEQPLADSVAEATVLFSDLVGFTPLAARLSPEDLVERLGELFAAFDAAVERLGLEKIKTIGDAYMAAGGVPVARPDHAPAVVELALAMQDAVAELNRAHGWTLALRIGIHTGPLVAGVIGRRRFSYDVWGDTVNTASRMESHGLPGAIQLSEATRQHLGDRYPLEERPALEVKGKGPMRTYLLRV